LQAIFYFSCAAFDKRIRSLKCHSQTLVTSGIFPLAGADETAALSIKLMRPAPPSCDILAISYCTIMRRWAR
jgi:hypothetical protein